MSTVQFGARCSDGTILMSDRRAQPEGNAACIYIPKIFPAARILWGPAGDFNTFQALRTAVGNNFNGKSPTLADFQTFAKTTLRDLNAAMRTQTNDMTRDTGLLIAYFNQPENPLYGIDPNGVLAEIPAGQGAIIGSGKMIGSEWINQYLKPTMTMEQTVALGYFIVRRLEYFYPNIGVGVAHLHPQIWYLPRTGGGTVPTEETDAAKLAAMEREATRRIGMLLRGVPLDF